MTSDFRAAVAANPQRSGVFLDFDGTISDIVEVPSDARPVEGARGVLSELAPKLAVVSIVSGRSARQLLEWLGPDIEIWGVHGAEHVVDGRVELSDFAAPYAGVMAEVRAELEKRCAELGIPGVLVEDKEAVVGVHYRNAPVSREARESLERITEDVAGAHGLRMLPGRMVMELKPPVDFSKADVVKRLAQEHELRAAAFLGDDVGDLAAFDALDELAAQGVATVRVGVRSDESPEELLERADEIVEGPRATVAWLRSLLEA
ncbi:MAG: trehalose-phosphatase [Actinomycetota bacterium]